MFRVDRSTRGGGVILYVSQSIEAVLLDHFDDVAFSECVFCMLNLSGNKLVVGVCYRSPASTYENDEALLSLFNSIANVVRNYNCLIMGDFNLPNIDFGSFSVSGSDDSFCRQNSGLCAG